MKKTILFLLLLASGSVFAQNVGIGTRDPKNKLHIAGGVRIDSLSNQKDTGLILHNAAGDLYSLKFTGKKTDVLHGDGSFSAAAAVTDAWLLGGNAGTDSAVNFLGTLDKQPIMFRVNNEFFGTFSKHNIAIGKEAMAWSYLNDFGRIGGIDNVAIGNFSLWNTGGKRSVGVGHYTISDIRGDDNTAVGAMAMTGRRDGQGVVGQGSGNVALGTRALTTLHSGSQNTVVGAGSLSGLSNFGTTRFSGNTAVGFQSMKNYAPYEGPPDGNNVAVGASALYSNIHGPENTAVGYQALFTDPSSFRQTAIGFKALYSNTNGIHNTAVGHAALFANTLGENNTAVGFASLANNSTGINNTAVGKDALTSNTSGKHNTAHGNEALLLNTTGFENTAVGHASLRASTSGNYNTANGSQALFINTTGSYNSAFGFKAMFTNRTGGNNTAIGFKALNFNSTGSNNTATGFEALNTNTTGSFNTAIGFRADVTSANLTNATAIGYDAKVNASNKVRIGNAAVTKIEGQVPFTTPSDGRFKFNVTEEVQGLTFIMKLRPVVYQFDVKKFDKVDDVQFASLMSDYEKAASIKRSGFIAQEVEKAALESRYNFSGIVRPEKADEHYSLSYESFVVPLVKAVQEQQAIIERQQAEIDELKTLIRRVMPKQ